MEKNIPLRDVFTLIEKQTNYSIAYGNSQLNLNKKISVSLKNATIDEALTSILKDFNHSYKINGYHIILIPGKNEEKPIEEKKVVKRNVKGKVIDESGEPAPYAHVVVLNRQQFYAVTDSIGNFTIANVPIGHYTIQISYLGYETKTVSIEVDSIQRPYWEVVLSTSTHELNEVVVTARKFEETVQSVPMSIATMSSNYIASKNVNDIAEATLLIPNVSAFKTRSSSSNGAMYIRGIGQDDNVFTSDAGVGLYVDDMILSIPQGMVLDFLDIERIEVLRGPQGTLYGRNTMAGAIKYITKKPENRFALTVDGTTGNYDRFDLKASVNVPIVKNKLLTRLSFGTFNRGGYELNTYNNKRTDTKSTLAGRFNLMYLASENIKLEFKLDGLRDRPSIRVGSLLKPQQTALDYPGLQNGDIVTIPKEEPFQVRSNIDTKLSLDSWSTSGIFTWRKDNHSLKSVTAFRQLDEDSRSDFDASEARATDAFIIHGHRQISEEVQYQYYSNRFNLVSGVFYLHIKDEQFDGTDASAKGFSMDAEYDQTLNSYAAYAQASFEVVKNLSLTAGIRYTLDNKIFNRRQERHIANLSAHDYNTFGGYGNGNVANPPSQYPGNGTQMTNIKDATKSWTSLIPRFGIDYKISDVLMYASVSEGSKSGGFNARANEMANPKQKEPYNPEFVWSYEFGIKSSFFNNRFINNIALFYNDYRDLQLSTFCSTDTDGDGVDDMYLPLFTNAARAVTKGFEYEFSAKPMKFLMIYGGIGYTNAQYKKYVEKDVDVSKQRKFANSPEWTGSVSIDVSIPVFRKYTLSIGNNIDYQGSRFLTVSNISELRQPAYTLYNIYSNIKTNDDKWQLSFGIKNVMDERYLVAGLDASSVPFGIINGFYGEPRTWFLSLRFKM